MTKTRKQIKRIPQGEIKPFSAYHTEQVSELFGVHPLKVRSLAVDLKGVKIGKNYTFLGENLLRYLGSAKIEDVAKS